MKFVYSTFKRDYLGKKHTFYTIFEDENDAVNSLDYRINSEMESLPAKEFEVCYRKPSAIDWPLIHEWAIYRVLPNGDRTVCSLYGLEEHHFAEKES